MSRRPLEREKSFFQTVISYTGTENGTCENHCVKQLFQCNTYRDGLTPKERFDEFSLTSHNVCNSSKLSYNRRVGLHYASVEHIRFSFQRALCIGCFS